MTAVGGLGQVIQGVGSARTREARARGNEWLPWLVCPAESGRL